MRVLCLILASALSGVPAAGAALDPGTRHVRLDNGLTLIVCERPEATAVAVQVYADAGGAQEVPGTTGAFQVLRHIFNAQAQAAGWMGARGNARLDANTFVNQSVPVNELGKYLDFESARIAAPDFSRFEEARTRAIADRRQREAAWILEEVRRVAFFAHPAGVPAFGYRGDLERLSADDVQSYWRRYYVPANLIVTIVGPVRFEEAREVVGQRLGKLRGAARPPELRCVEPPQRAERRIVPRQADRGAVLMAYHKGSAAADAAYPVWDVLAPLLRDRLQKALMGEKKLVERVHVDVEMASMKYPGLFAILAFVPAGVDAAEVERRIDGEIARLQTERASDAEITAVRHEPRWEAVPNHEIGAELADWFAMTGDYRNMFRHPERVARVTAEEVRSLAADRLRVENRTIVTVNGAR